MHLAILMTNTDESAFAQRHPKDGKKFTTLIQNVRPDWKTTSYCVKDNEFPNNISQYDGVMITGSPASVFDDDPWVAVMMGLIKVIASLDMPLFGACFGHQAIALALGGQVETNPDGWVFGVTEMDVTRHEQWTNELGQTLTQYASHIEQVTRLPAGAKVLLSSTVCPIAGFAIGLNIYTTQNHPEMDKDFISVLIDELEPKVGVEVAQIARASLAVHVDTAVYAETIARFFELAQNPETE